MNDGFLLQAVIYLSAAVVCVPLAKRLGMGSVLGYLIAGMLIGPFVFDFIGAAGKDIMHFAEFGVVMMLFLIGLELEPARLWKIRKHILGIGFSQVAGTVLFLFLIALLFNIQWQTALAASLAIAMSSTAIVLQSLKEKNLLNSAAGQNSFAVLLFQDISVIPILALLPLLAIHPADPLLNSDRSWLGNLPGRSQTLVVLGAVFLVITAGRFIIVPLLRIVAKTRLRELFTASSLLIVVAIAFLMKEVGLSPALGTFLAGVVLANSEFKHELESDLDPFKGLLLGLFFIAVGASINFHLIGSQPLLITLLTLGIILIKVIILSSLGKIFKLSNKQNLIFALGLSQIGEFAFVLFSFIGQFHILSTENTDLMMAVTALSMTITPVLILVNEKFILPQLGTKDIARPEPDIIDQKNKVIIAGFSHFGSTLGRFLRANGVEATILDNDSDLVDLLRKMGFKVYYGDATRVDLLKSAGASEAQILITAINSPEINSQLVETIKKHFPNLEMMVRARNRYDAYELIDLGVKNIYRQHLDTSIRLGVDVLKKLGQRSYSATRAAQNFIKYDEEAMWKLAEHRHDRQAYIFNVRKQIELQEMLLNNDKNLDPTKNDHAWDSEFLRENVTGTK